MVIQHFLSWKTKKTKYFYKGFSRPKEAEGGRLVKETDFEAEKKNLLPKLFSFLTLLLCVMAFFPLKMP